MPLPHRCDESCVCPEDGLQLIYAPGSDEHACQDVACIFGHGYESVLTALLEERLQALVEGFEPPESEMWMGRMGLDVRGWRLRRHRWRYVDTVDVNSAYL